MGLCHHASAANIVLPAMTTSLRSRYRADWFDHYERRLAEKHAQLLEGLTGEHFKVVDTSGPLVYRVIRYDPNEEAANEG